MVYLSALIVRVIAFAAILGLLPRRIVPFSVRAALALSLLLFTVPLIPDMAAADDPGSLDMGLSLLSFVHWLETLFTGSSVSGEPRVVTNFTVIVGEATIGALLGIAVSAGAYAAKVMACWFSGLIFDPSFSRSDHSSAAVSSMEAIFLLLFIYTLFTMPGFHSVWLFFGTSFAALPFFWDVGNAASAAPVDTFATLVAETGATSLLVALCLAVPVFFVSLVVDFLYYLFKRYFPEGFSEHLVHATRMPALVLIITLGLYSFSSDLAVFLEQSIDPSRVEQIIQNVKD